MKKVLSPTALWIGAKLLSTIPLFLLGVGFVSAKALIIAKIAFVFAIILFFQYYTGAGKVNLLSVTHLLNKNIITKHYQNYLM